MIELSIAVNELAKEKLRTQQLEKTFLHIFKPSEDNDRFCAYCDLYLTDKVHERVHEGLAPGEMK